MAPYLRVAPTDLSAISTRHEGVFPTELVQRIVDGRQALTLHGSAMPIWGDAFSKSRKGLSEAEVRQRIEAIVRYLEAIQERAAE